MSAKSARVHPSRRGSLFDYDANLAQIDSLLTRVTRSGYTSRATTPFAAISRGTTPEEELQEGSPLVRIKCDDSDVCLEERQPEPCRTTDTVDPTPSSPIWAVRDTVWAFLSAIAASVLILLFSLTVLGAVRLHRKLELKWAAVREAWPRRCSCAGSSDLRTALKDLFGTVASECAKMLRAMLRAPERLLLELLPMRTRALWYGAEPAEPSAGPHSGHESVGEGLGVQLYFAAVLVLALAWVPASTASGSSSWDELRIGIRELVVCVLLVLPALLLAIRLAERPTSWPLSSDQPRHALSPMVLTLGAALEALSMTAVALSAGVPATSLVKKALSCVLLDFTWVGGTDAMFATLLLGAVLCSLWLQLQYSQFCSPTQPSVHSHTASLLFAGPLLVGMVATSVKFSSCVLDSSSGALLVSASLGLSSDGTLDLSNPDALMCGSSTHHVYLYSSVILLFLNLPGAALVAVNSSRYGDVKSVGLVAMLDTVLSVTTVAAASALQQDPSKALPALLAGCVCLANLRGLLRPCAVSYLNDLSTCAAGLSSSAALIALVAYHADFQDGSVTAVLIILGVALLWSGYAARVITSPSREPVMQLIEGLREAGVTNQRVLAEQIVVQMGELESEELLETATTLCVLLGDGKDSDTEEELRELLLALQLIGSGLVEWCSSVLLRSPSPEDGPEQLMVQFGVMRVVATLVDIVAAHQRLGEECVGTPSEELAVQAPSRLRACVMQTMAENPVCYELVLASVACLDALRRCSGLNDDRYNLLLVLSAIHSSRLHMEPCELEHRCRSLMTELLQCSTPGPELLSLFPPKDFSTTKSSCSVVSSGAPQLPVPVRLALLPPLLSWIDTIKLPLLGSHALAQEPESDTSASSSHTRADLEAAQVCLQTLQALLACDSTVSSEQHGCMAWLVSQGHSSHLALKALVLLTTQSGSGQLKQLMLQAGAIPMLTAVLTSNATQPTNLGQLTCAAVSLLTHLSSRKDFDGLVSMLGFVMAHQQHECEPNSSNHVTVAVLGALLQLAESDDTLLAAMCSSGLVHTMCVGMSSSCGRARTLRLALLNTCAHSVHVRAMLVQERSLATALLTALVPLLHRNFPALEPTLCELFQILALELTPGHLSMFQHVEEPVLRHALALLSVHLNPKHLQAEWPRGDPPKGVQPGSRAGLILSPEDVRPGGPELVAAVIQADRFGVEWLELTGTKLTLAAGCLIGEAIGASSIKAVVTPAGVPIEVLALHHSSRAALSAQSCQDADLAIILGVLMPPACPRSIQASDVGLSLGVAESSLHLDLSCNQLTDEGAKHLAMCLQNIPTLMVLNISGNPLIHQSGLTAIKKGVLAHPKLQTVIFGSSADCMSIDKPGKATPPKPKGGLVSSGVLTVSKWLTAQTVRSTEALRFNSRHLDAQDANLLMCMLEVNPEITIVDLSCNQLRDAGTAPLCAVLPLQLETLKELDVSSNSISVHTIAKICDSLCQLPSLHRLDISGNCSPCDWDAASLGSLRQLRQTCSDLLLLAGERPRQLRFEPLTDSQANLLDLSGSGVDDQAASLFLMPLLEGCSYHTVDLSDNFLGHDLIFNMLDMLEAEHVILGRVTLPLGQLRCEDPVLDLSHSNLSSTHCVVLAGILCRFNIVSLDLSGNSIGGEAMARCLDLVPGLRTLNVSCNLFAESCKGLAALCSAVKQHMCLQTLTVADGVVLHLEPLRAALHSTVRPTDQQVLVDCRGSKPHLMHSEAVLLSAILAEYAHAIQILWLSPSEDAPGVAAGNTWDALLPMLRRCTVLNMDGCLMASPASVEALCKLLGDGALKSLSLNRCELDDAQICELTFMLAQNTTVTELWLAGNRFGSAGLGALQDMMEVSSCIQRVLVEYEYPVNALRDVGGLGMLTVNLRDGCLVVDLGHTASQPAMVVDSRVEFGSQRPDQEGHGAQIVPVCRRGLGKLSSVGDRRGDSPERQAEELAGVLQELVSLSASPVHSVLFCVSPDTMSTQQQSLRDAASAAQLPLLSIVSRPTAVACAYGLVAGQQAVVLHLGATSSTAWVIEVDGSQQVLILASSTNTTPVGQILDECVLELVLSGRNHSLPAPQKDAALQICSEAKHRLSVLQQVEVKLSLREPAVIVTRERLEAVAAARTTPAIAALGAALGSIGQSASDWGGEVILCGGSATVPMLQHQVAAALGPAANLLCHPSPAKTAAYGALRLSTQLQRSSASLPSLLAPRSMKLGVRSAGTEAGFQASIAVDYAEIIHCQGRSQQGYTMMAISPSTGQVEHIDLFNPFEQQAAAQQLALRVQGLAEGTIVAAAICGEVQDTSKDVKAVAASEAVIGAAFRSVGATKLISLGYRCSWAMIGVKGRGALVEECGVLPQNEIFVEVDVEVGTDTRTTYESG